MNIKQSGVLYFQFMRIVILLFRQFNFVVANDCECEVEGWSNWSDPDATCGTALKTRRRVCSSFNGLTLGLTCREKGHYTRQEFESVVLTDCRKLSMNVKFCQVIFRY